MVEGRKVTNEVALYRLEDVVQAIRNMAPDMAAVKLAAETAGTQKETLRNKAALAVSRAFLAGFGPRMFSAIVADTLPESPRRGVNISETWRIMENHPQARNLAAAWARGDFGKIAVAEALKEVRPAPDLLDSVRRAVKRAYKDGTAVDAIHTAVDSAVMEAEQEVENAETDEDEEAEQQEPATRARATRSA